MTSTLEAPGCPRCGETMVLKTAERGSYAGQQFWACPRFPKCWGKRGISGQAVATVSHEPAPSAVSSAVSPAPGASAQATFERRLAARRNRVRAAWPVLVGITLILMVLAYLVGLSLGLPWLGATAAALVAMAMLYLVVDRPQFIDAWRVGAEGERKTGRRLAELESAGFVVLHDRLAPGYGGNIDQLVIGRSGVWVVETKSLKGSVELTNDRLFVNGQARDKIIDQVYREATATQIALGDALKPLGVTATPVLCLHRARLPWFDRQIRGVTLVNGRSLARLIRNAPTVLTAEQTQGIAAAAQRILVAARSRKG